MGSKARVAGDSFKCPGEDVILMVLTNSVELEINGKVEPERMAELICKNCQDEYRKDVLGNEIGSNRGKSSNNNASKSS